MIKTSGFGCDIDKVYEEALKIKAEKSMKAAVDHFAYETCWTKADAKRYITSEEFRANYKRQANHETNGLTLNM